MTNRTHTIHSNITETCPVLMNTWKLGKLLKKYCQNLTSCKIFNSKSDACLKCWFKIWHVVKTLIQNLTRQKKFMLFTKTFSFKKSCFLERILPSKSCFSEIFFSWKSCFSKLHVKRKFCAFYGLNWIKTWFFMCIFFKICFLKIFFSSKSCCLKTYFSSKADAS